ncbi:hypothetical protein K469DRAFT_742415 [Zopfia rhizophila CBS 207.26]|uniref:Putative phospholipase n=1 Tax=Zopfia rhizophila CBS 207.26 TaxID=1314779 RepID=A0A6A6DDV3_9PEZI|nr:hypothetical protein K469DRAFT_742415 [Zopfia rhizophila CBS 207.26]
MTWLTRFNPIPAFPSYTGPYKVGSTDVEIPTTDLADPSVSPTNSVPTIAFRIFYPCQPDSAQQSVRWIPSPQREYIGAYARFLGASSAFSHVFSVLPQLLYYISIPVCHDAQILEPPTHSKKWPVMIFSHGLGGSRNAYSHLLGSLSSHGIVVIAPDHRDGSSPLSFVCDVEGKDKTKKVEYRKVAHKASTEVYESRDDQLRTRLWELGLIHDAILKIDGGVKIKNTANTRSNKHDSRDILAMFSHLLDVQSGSIAFAGHSFGAATMVQFVKSVFYYSDSQPLDYKPLFTLSKSSSLISQITPSSPVILLDLWTLPIQSPATAWLKDKSMPCYTSSNGGASLLAILSEAFYKWSSNLRETKRVVAKPPESSNKFPGQPGPHIYYPVASAHLSQSDFGVLFPWITTKIFGAKEPERVLKLNVRAILQVLRDSNLEVADTCIADLELDEDHAKTDLATSQPQDWKILSSAKDTVRGWVSLTTDPDPSDEQSKPVAAPSDAVIEGEVLGEVVHEPERSSRI